MTYSTTTHDYDTSQASPTHVLTVVPEQRERWQRLLLKGIANRLDIRPDGASLIDGGGQVRRYRIASLSRPGTYHAVMVSKPLDGAPVTACDCEAGRVPIPCMHAALGVDMANAWPRDMPMLRQPHLVAPSPAYRDGDAVRVLSSGKRGIVSYNSLSGGRDWMYLVNGPRGAALGAFLGSELEADRVDAPDAAATAALFTAPRERRVASRAKSGRRS